MTALAKAPTPQGGASLPRPDPGRQVVIEAVDWPTYEAIGAALADRPNLRLTYDRGRLEIMTLSPEHERRKYLFGRLIDVLGEEANLPIAGFGSTTYKRERAERGLEPDQCYYHRNLDRVRGLQRIDLTRDPPPDLAIEIDVTHSSLDRMRIYAALGVPEVWRFEGGRLEVYLLAGDGHYAQSAHSPTFPSIPVAELVRFVDLGVADSDTAMSRAFRAWVREQLARPA